MPKLPTISGMEAIKAFSRAGWIPHRQAGSHVVLRKEGSKMITGREGNENNFELFLIFSTVLS